MKWNPQVSPRARKLGFFSYNIFMTPEDFKERMEEIAKSGGGEEPHIEADQLIIELLSQIGYKEGAEIFSKMTKWYS